MLYVGVMNDILELFPYLRLAVEIIVVLSLIYTTEFSIEAFHGLWRGGVINNIHRIFGKVLQTIYSVASVLGVY